MGVSLVPTGQLDTATRRAARLLVDDAFAGDFSDADWRHALGGLSAIDDGAALYRARGWQPWRGSTWAMTPSGPLRTPEDDDAVFVLPVAGDLDLDGALTCDRRPGDLW